MKNNVISSSTNTHNISNSSVEIYDIALNEY